jgi:hypothetical protein
MNQPVDLAPALCGLVLFFQSSGTTAAEFISCAARRLVDGHHDGACVCSWLRRIDSLIFTLRLLCGLTFDMSGPPPAWPTQRNIDKRSGVGQAGGGPLDGRVRPHFAT